MTLSRLAAVVFLVTSLVVIDGFRVESLAQSAPPLKFPQTRHTVRVHDKTELWNALRHVESSTTVVLAPGVYELWPNDFTVGGDPTKEDDRPVADIVIRGETGRREDVMIRGRGMDSHRTPVAFRLRNVQNLTIADLSIGETAQHAIMMAGFKGCDRIHVYNCYFFNTGQQFIKANADRHGAFKGPDDCIVEYCTFEYLPRTVEVNGVSTDGVYGPVNGYTNAIDVHVGRRWIIRHNVFRNIRSREGSPRSGRNSVPAVLMWNGATDTITEDNTFINCERAIAYGNQVAKDIPVPYNHRGGIIRNNFIYRDADVRGDAGITVWDSPDTRVCHNTIFQNVDAPGSKSYPNSIEYRFPRTVNVEIKNNLTDGLVARRNDASAVVEGNYTRAAASMFVAPAAGDLHLRMPEARVVIGKGVGAPECGPDRDGDPRPPRPDIGAVQKR